MIVEIAEIRRRPVVFQIRRRGEYPVAHAEQGAAYEVPREARYVLPSLATGQRTNRRSCLLACAFTLGGFFTRLFARFAGWFPGPFAGRLFRLFLYRVETFLQYRKHLTRARKHRRRTTAD